MIGIVFRAIGQLGKYAQQATSQVIKDAPDVHMAAPDVQRAVQKTYSLHQAKPLFR